MFWIIMTGVVCLFVGWNVPQPGFAIKAEDWIRSKLKLGQKTRITTGTGSAKPGP